MSDEHDDCLEGDVIAVFRPVLFFCAILWIDFVEVCFLSGFVVLESYITYQKKCYNHPLIVELLILQRNG